jgi:tight adherence protein B
MMLWISLCLAIAAAALATLAVRVCVRATRFYLHSQRVMVATDLASMFIFLSTGRLMMMSLGACAMVGVVVAALHLPWPACVLLSVACLILPRLLVGRLRSARRKRIAMQLPDALSLWSGLMRSGQGTLQALHQVAEHQPAPIGEELRLLVRQCRVGVPIESAVDELRVRSGVADLALLGTLLRAARELGGNLGESLQRLADVMRTRLAMEGRIQSLTAQGRLQGVIVGVLPLALLAVLALMEPNAMSVLYKQPLGWLADLLIIVLEAVGFVLIRRIVSIDV